MHELRMSDLPTVITCSAIKEQFCIVFDVKTSLTINLSGSHGP
jgi:hypothetical protein